MGVTGVPKRVGQCAILSVCQGIRKMGSTAVKLLGQRPNGEPGFCDFVVEFGVSVLKGNKTKQLSRGYRFLAMTHVLAAAVPTKRPPMQKSNPARRRQGKQLHRNKTKDHTCLFKETEIREPLLNFLSLGGAWFCPHLAK